MKLSASLFLLYLVLLIYLGVVVTLTSLNLNQFTEAISILVIILALFVVLVTKRNEHRYTSGNQSQDFRIRELSVGKEKFNLSGIQCLVISVGTIISSVLSARGLTGLWPSGVYSSFRSRTSTYLSYQAFNSDLFQFEKTGVLSPYFWTLVVVKATFIFSLCYYTTRERSLNVPENLLLLISCASLLYYGAARGTGLELLQVLLALLFSFSMKERIREKGIRNFLVILKAGGFLSVGLLLYSSLLSLRGVSKRSRMVTPEWIWTASDQTFDFITQLQILLLSVYGYFTFGLYYLSNLIQFTWHEHPYKLFFGELPSVYDAMKFDVRSFIQPVVAVGVRWQPDAGLLIGKFGLFGMLVAVAFLAVIARKLDSRKSIAAHASLYFIFMQMLSLPLGNFLWVDRPLLLVAFLSLCLTYVLPMINVNNGKQEGNGDFS
jgi:hypothetical protein